MADTPLTCFVSYSNGDVDQELLQYLHYLLERSSGQKYSLITDTRLPLEEDLPKFMRVLNAVDAVFILMTPGYKAAVTSQSGILYLEYSIIKDRHLSIHRSLKEGSNASEVPGYFDLFPIHLKGNQQEALLPELAHLPVVDLSRLSVERNRTGEFIASRETRSRYAPLLTRVSERIIAHRTVKSQSFAERYKENYVALFLNRRERPNLSPDDEAAYLRYISGVFVQTHAFKRIRDHTVFALIGRKGSGKTAITSFLAVNQRRRYKGHIRIIADDFNLATAYNVFKTQRVSSDTSHIFTRELCMEFAWEAFMMLCAMEILAKLYEEGHLSSEQCRHVPPMASHLDIVRKTWASSGSEDSKKAYYQHAFEAVMYFIDDCISGARSEKRFFASDLQGRFTRERYLEFVFTGEVLAAFDKVLSTCTKSFLITLDGFDTAFDRFRRPGSNVDSEWPGPRLPDEEIYARAKFEMLWLSSLLHLLLKIVDRDNHSQHFYELMDLCVTVPHDRFVEIARSDRDASRYLQRYSYIDWTGIELAILVRKRLEKLMSHEVDKVQYPRPVERLNQLMKEKLSHLPQEIRFNHGDAEYRLPLFLYILRHTFWRPRDVLIYYANILAASQDMARIDRSLTAEGVRRVISEATYQVIQTEFITEFASVLTNIEEVVSAFAANSQFLQFDDLAAIVGPIRFEFAAGAGLATSIEDKIAFLFEIGFLGITRQTWESEDNYLPKHAFFFNGGSRFLKLAGTSKYRSCVYVIHPVFKEFLQLNTVGRELVLDVNWDVLQVVDDLYLQGSGVG